MKIFPIEYLLANNSFPDIGLWYVFKIKHCIFSLSSLSSYIIYFAQLKFLPPPTSAKKKINLLNLRPKMLIFAYLLVGAITWKRYHVSFPNLLCISLMTSSRTSSIMAEKKFKLPIYFDFSHFTSIIQVQYKRWRAIVECALVSSRRHRRWAKGAMDSTSVFFLPLLLPITLWENKLG